MDLLINGDTWSVKLMEEDAFIHKWGEGFEALTVLEAKLLYFHDDGIALDTVIHELCHAYYSYLCVNSTQLGSDQLEEIWCDMFGMHGAKIIRQARQVFKWLKAEAK